MCLRRLRIGRGVNPTNPASFHSGGEEAKAYCFNYIYIFKKIIFAWLFIHLFSLSGEYGRFRMLLEVCKTYQ